MTDLADVTTTAPPRLSWRSLIAGGALVAVAFTGTVGFLHTPAGRPILSFALGGACPLGMSRATLDPGRREALRRQSLAARPHSEASAPNRDAFGVALGRTNREQITAWAANHGVACRSESQGAGLACDGVPQEIVGATGGERGSMYYRFDPAGHVVGVLRMVRVPEPDRAAALAGAEQKSLRERLGEPLRVTGRADPAYLASGPLRQARVEHRFRDFSATASVTNMGRDEYLLTEEAQVF